MTHGFLAVNNNNQVLVSSDTRNLHFLGKPGLQSSAVKCSRYGGSALFKYHVYSPVPIVPFFTMPTNDYYCITAIRDLGGNIWEIEILRSGLYISTEFVRQPASGYAATSYGYVRVTRRSAALAKRRPSSII